MLCFSGRSTRCVRSIVQDLGWETALNEFPALMRCVFQSWVFCSSCSTTMSLMMGRPRRMITTFCAMADWLLLGSFANWGWGCRRSLRLSACVCTSFDDKVIYLLGCRKLTRSQSCNSAEIGDCGTYLSIHQLCSISSTWLLGNPGTDSGQSVPFLSSACGAGSFGRIQI